MIDRKTAPRVNQVKHIDFVSPLKKTVNGIHFYLMNKGIDETVRLELYFDAGKINAENGISSFTNGLLLSGTNSKNAIEIQDQINSLGGFYETSVGMEQAVLSLYCLNEYLQELTSILSKSIFEANFPAKEVDEYLADKKQQHLISMEKVGMLARREFQQQLLFSDARYASVINENTFDIISRDQLVDFHEKHYKNGLHRVVIVGDITEAELDAIIDRFSAFNFSSNEEYSDSFLPNPGKFHTPKDGAMQSAIRVGRLLFNKSHEDYLDFNVLNTILGDYFGSRLMSNIREDKGYTYGIGSMINEMNKTGYFLVGTEVKKEVVDDAIVQIKYEFERLQNELVDDGELNLVKNYLLGQLLKSADGPFAMTDLYMSVEIHNETLDFFNKAIQSINSITPQRVQDLACKYLKWEDMTIVTAG